MPFLQARNRVLNWVNPPVVILLYHRVTKLKKDPQLLSVTPENFRSHLQFLKKNVPVLKFEDDWSNVKKPAVVITFDDGYADNFVEALPILEEVDIPATFFIATGNIGLCEEFWWDELERIILDSHASPSYFRLRDEQFGRRWPTTVEIERYTLYKDMLRLINQVGPATRDNWMEQLRSWVKIGEYGRNTHRAMTVDELSNLAQSSLATIGAHAVSHTPLSSLTPEQQTREIGESKMQLERWIGREVKFFSYPFGGKADYNSMSIELCKKYGFVKAASNFPGQFHYWSDPFQIPRHLVRNWPLDVFYKKMCSFWVS
jgi:peptidoglycan/xylan/chitin deacetylase (PgdA/CDA1 family)